MCGVGVETCMHEFVECPELEGYFGRIKGLIQRCWEGGLLEELEWRELWLFGVKMKRYNVNLLNYVLSHARFAVKRRRNIAHYEKKKVEVWSIFKSMVESEVTLLYSYVKEEEFREGFIEGSTFIEIGDEGRVVFDFGGGTV